MKGYCLKCRKKVDMIEPFCVKITKNNRYLLKGYCKKCRCNVNLFISKNDKFLNSSKKYQL